MRVDSKYQKRMTSHVYAGDFEFRSHPFTPQGKHQIDIYSRGASHIHMASIADFTETPNSSVGAEVLQFGTAANKVIALPAVIVSAKYASGKLKTFSMTMIDKAVINEAIPDDAFLVSGEPHDILRDARAKPENVVELDRAYPNVLDAVTH